MANASNAARIVNSVPRSPQVPFPLSIDKRLKTSLTDQIYLGLREAIHNGSLPFKSRMPSWQDLASQLGVARGTVRRAYERLIDGQLIESRGAAGTWITKAAAGAVAPGGPARTTELPGMFYEFDSKPGVFQMGIPAQDAFPLTQWASICQKAMRDELKTPIVYGDPRGDANLRREISAYLAIARGLNCTAEQVVITNGFSGALSLLIKALRFEKQDVWVEDPGYPRTRRALELAGVFPRDCAVDAEGLIVASAREHWPNARAAIVTPGQQAPLGMQMSLSRRMELIDWARQSGAWIIEDDYAGELQLEGRAAPSLAALDSSDCVFHVGTFSKTVGPRLRVGFAVIPRSHISHVSEMAGYLFPAASALTQKALAGFISDGHYLRHLRKVKKLYASRKRLVVETLASRAPELMIEEKGALSVRLFLSDHIDDVALAEQLSAAGFSPAPLSSWYASRRQRKGLLLGITNVSERTVVADCERFIGIVHG